MNYLITGGCGFLGSNIAQSLIKMKNDVFIFDNLSRLGSEKNLVWLNDFGKSTFIYGDIRNREDIEKTIIETKPHVIFHLAGQVAMTTSIKNPRLDFETNVVGSFNLLDSVRKHSPTSVIIYSSTNKVYGDLEWVNYTEKEKRYISLEYPNGFPETIPLDFHSPYGTSKGSADQYMLDFYRMFNIRTAVFRHSSMFGGRQFSTYDQGWIGWFIQQALDQKNTKSVKPFTISGNGKQVRDVLFVDDMVRLYLTAAEQIESIKGNAFNIGGGINNSLSLLELFEYLENRVNIKLNFTKLPPRESDQKIFVADITKITNKIGWKPKIDKFSGVDKMVNWIMESK